MVGSWSIIKTGSKDKPAAIPVKNQDVYPFQDSARIWHADWRTNAGQALGY